MQAAALHLPRSSSMMPKQWRSAVVLIHIPGSSRYQPLSKRCQPPDWLTLHFTSGQLLVWQLSLCNQISQVRPGSINPALVQASPKRKLAEELWRKGWDSNPRRTLLTPSPVFKTGAIIHLGHPSMCAWDGLHPFGPAPADASIIYVSLIHACGPWRTRRFIYRRASVIMQ